MHNSCQFLVTHSTDAVGIAQHRISRAELGASSIKHRLHISVRPKLAMAAMEALLAKFVFFSHHFTSILKISPMLST